MILCKQGSSFPPPATMLIDPYEGPDLMRPTDFPRDFINRKHPEDYILSPKPTVPEYIVHDSTRLFLRISWKSAKGYLPMTFMVDTTNPTSVSFCPEGMEGMLDNGFGLVDKSLGYKYVHVHHGESGEDFFPARMHFSQVKSVNILGLRALMKLGLHVDSKGFRFDHEIPWF
jgi:hypothetical protein